jgi:transcriptional regulator NrdR family protein
MDDEEEFVKEYPGLKGSLTAVLSDKFHNEIRKATIDKQKIKEAISPLINELEKHRNYEGNLTITKEMCEIILQRLKGLNQNE